MKKTIGLLIILFVAVLNSYAKNPSGVISGYKINGVCEKIDISSQTAYGREAHFDFQVKRDLDARIKSRIEACPSGKIKEWTRFSLEDAKAQKALGEHDRMFWSLWEVKSLTPYRCGIISNPNSTIKLVLMDFTVKGRRRKEITGNKLLAVFTVDSKLSPQRSLVQHISNETVYDDRRKVVAKYVCDIDSDGLVEVIMMDSRYAGHNYWITKFAPDFSWIKEDFVDGERGD